MVHGIVTKHEMSDVKCVCVMGKNLKNGEDDMVELGGAYAANLRLGMG